MLTAEAGTVSWCSPTPKDLTQYGTFSFAILFREFISTKFFYKFERSFVNSKNIFLAFSKTNKTKIVWKFGFSPFVLAGIIYFSVVITSKRRMYSKLCSGRYPYQFSVSCEVRLTIFLGRSSRAGTMCQSTL